MKLLEISVLIFYTFNSLAIKSCESSCNNNFLIESDKASELDLETGNKSFFMALQTTISKQKDTVFIRFYVKGNLQDEKKYRVNSIDCTLNMANDSLIINGEMLIPMFKNSKNERYLQIGKVIVIYPSKKEVIVKDKSNTGKALLLSITKFEIEK